MKPKIDKAVKALVRAGLVEEAVGPRRLLPIEIISLVRHYRGDRDFEDMTREFQEYELLFALVFKTSGPCTVEDALVRANVLCGVKAREMIRDALDLCKVPFGTRTLPAKTPKKADESRVIEWNWGACLGGGRTE